MEKIEYTLMASLESDFWWYKGLHRAVTERLVRMQLPANSTVLDAGCGTGGMLKHLLTNPVACQYRLLGLEWHPDAAAIARQKTGLGIIRGSVNKMPFAQQSLDAIISQDVLYHANVDEPAALGEFHRCLRPGGHLLLSLPAFEWMRSAHDRHVHGVRRYTATHCRQLLAGHGFTDIQTGYWNSLLFPLMAIQRLTVGKHQQASDVHTLPPWLDSLFFSVLDSERRLGLKLPYGGSVWAWARRQ